MKKYSTLNEIFSEERAKHIPLVEMFLRNRKSFFVDFWGNLRRVDYRNIYIPELYKERSSPIILSGGWGSGWEGIVPLAFSLTCEGYEVYMLSFPGYGDSENPSHGYIEYNPLHSAASVVEQFCHKLFGGQCKVHLVGHSMGGRILSEVARSRPDLVENLVLLNTSGINSYGLAGKFDLARRFVSSGIKTRRDYQKKLKASGEKDYMQPLIDLCERQKDPFSLDRIGQRLAEFRAICEGTLSETLRNVKVPIAFVYGADDSVFPVKRPTDVSTRAFSSQQDRFIDLELSVAAHRIIPASDISYINGLPHNPTLYHSEIAAAAIAHYLEG